MLLPRCQDGGLALLLVALLGGVVETVRSRRTARHIVRTSRRTASASSASSCLTCRSTKHWLAPKDHAAFGLGEIAPSGQNSEILEMARLLRGGSLPLEADSDDDEDEDSSDDDDDEDEEEKDASSDEEDSENDSDEETSSEATTTSSSTASAAEPVAVTIKTVTGSKLLDQTVELLTVTRSRDVASLKQSASKQLPSRPPVSAMQLTLHGKILDDDTLVEDLVDDDEEEDEEDDGDQSASGGLVLHLEMIPTVDPKFLYELEKKISDMTAAELLEAYAVNEAAVYQNSALLMQTEQLPVEDDDEEATEEEEVHKQKPAPQPVNAQLRERAAQIRQDLENTILKTERAQELLADPLPPTIRQQIAVVEVKGQRVRRPGTTGGAKGSWKRVLQHNLNVDWAVTIRHFLLFIFFGYFGGRTATSRAILLLGAPSVFLLQLRPVKLLLRQAMYAVLDHPPSILLSLLPAPQQSILSLDFKKAMETVYGQYVKESSPPLEQQKQDSYDEDDVVSGSDESDNEEESEQYESEDDASDEDSYED